MSSYAIGTELGEFGEMAGEGEYGEYEGEVGGAVNPLSEAEEIELASELLEINSEAELEQFLGSLISKVGRAAGGFLKSPVGRALGGIVKDVAKKALPMVGGTLGSMVAPGVGTALGSQLGSYASGLFELELESMPQEQAEFEVARRVVGLTATAANQAAQAQPRPGATPEMVARAAVAEAARDLAPGLRRMLQQRAGTAPGRSRTRRIPPGPGNRIPPGRRARTFGGDFWDVPPEEPRDADWGSDYPGQDGPTVGRWVRHGRRIVLHGL